MLKLPSGKYVLIDAGPSSHIGFMPYLRAHGIRKFEAIVISHPHADHIDGFEDLLWDCEVDKVYDPGVPHTLNTYQKILKTIEKKKIPYIQPKAGDVLHWDTYVHVRVLHPDDPSYGSINDNSIVLQVTFGDVKFLFAGDAENEAEQAILRRFSKLVRSQILKVGHHGSKSSSTPEFIRAIAPSYALISCGLDNSFGHPRPQTLETLKTAGAKVYRTDLDGYVFIRTDGKKIWGSKSKMPFPKTTLSPDTLVPFDLADWSENTGYSPWLEGTGVHREGGTLKITAGPNESFGLHRAGAPFRVRPMPAGTDWHVATDVALLPETESEAGLILFSGPASYLTLGTSGTGNIILRLFAARHERLFRHETVHASTGKLGIRQNGDHITFMAYDKEESDWERLWEFRCDDLPVDLNKAVIGLYAQSREGRPAEAAFKNFKTYAPAGDRPTHLTRKSRSERMDADTPTSSSKLLFLNPTVIETYDLWRTTKNLEEIAKIRSLNISTIEVHIAKLHEADAIPLEEILNYVVDQKTFEQVEEAVKTLNTDDKKAIKEHLPDVSYGKISIVLASIQKRSKTTE